VNGPRERVFRNLNVVQAEGLACVMCARPFMASDLLQPMLVGRSESGRRVFACAGDCAELAEMDS